jgi:hypothetical protein
VGSALVKAACKMLVKLTSVLDDTFTLFSKHDKNSSRNLESPDIGYAVNSFSCEPTTFIRNNINSSSSSNNNNNTRNNNSKSNNNNSSNILFVYLTNECINTRRVRPFSTNIMIQYFDYFLFTSFPFEHGITWSICYGNLYKT